MSETRGQERLPDDWAAPPRMAAAETQMAAADLPPELSWFYSQKGMPAAEPRSSVTPAPDTTAPAAGPGPGPNPAMSPLPGGAKPTPRQTYDFGGVKVIDQPMQGAELYGGMTPEQAQQQLSDLRFAKNIPPDPIATFVAQEGAKGLIYDRNMRPHRIAGSTETDPDVIAQKTAAQGNMVTMTIGGQQQQIPFDAARALYQVHPELFGGIEPKLPGAAGATTTAAGATTTAPGSANEPEVTKEDNPVIRPPPPTNMGTGVGQRQLPPGAGELIGGQAARDNETVAKFNADAANAQDKLAMINGIQDTLQQVYTGRTGATRQWIGQNVLKPLGVSDDAIRNWVGTNPSSAQYLDKGLMQLINNETGRLSGGYGIMQQIQHVFPSLETSPQTINMLMNSMKMAAYRTIRLRDQATDYQTQSRDNYINSSGATLYSPLSTFMSKFDQLYPATDYYQAAQAMTPGFSKEAWKPGTYDPQTAKPTAKAQSFLRLLPPNEGFYNPNGRQLRPNPATGQLEFAPPAGP